MKLSIDLDSVLCGFCEAWIDWCYDQNIIKEKITLQDIKTYDYLSKTFGEVCNDFFLKNPKKCYENWITPYPESKEFMDWCCDHFDTEIITHACKKETEFAKIEFCEKHFNFKNIRFVKKLHDKYIYLNESILIDDYPVHCVLNTSRNNNHSIIFNMNGEFGWSDLETYNHILKNEKLDRNKLWISFNYEYCKKILKMIKN